jgi:hypothetical protein
VLYVPSLAYKFPLGKLGIGISLSFDYYEFNLLFAVECTTF